MLDTVAWFKDTNINEMDIALNDVTMWYDYKKCDSIVNKDII